VLNTRQSRRREARASAADGIVAKSLTQEEVEALAAFRLEVRRYLAFAQRAAENNGVTMQQNQALLAIRAAPDQTLTVGELAELLFLRHHSAVELTNRLETAGLVVRRKDQQDARKVVLALTQRGSETLSQLAGDHLKEIQEHGPELARSLRRLIRGVPNAKRVG
jgi:DNA-binding MarR family transcriptional regulator